MKTLKYLIVLTSTFLFFSSIVATTLFAESDERNKPEHWSYEGECGPEHWGDLIHKNCKCKLGDMQSPIGISTTQKAKLDSINFHYYATPLKIINNGHTMQINYGCGSSVSIGNKRYELIQFHFHCPSEHKIHGKSYDMEAHLVHKGAHGELAVIAVFMEEGKENDFIKTLWSNFPKEQGKEYTHTDLKINVNQILPKNTAAYYTYHGSLTTPPCSEIVNWLVLKTPIQVSKAELEKFASIFKRDARPIQPQHGRIVKESY
ncbi:MAG: carbonic anhydrase family protein [Candidatus Jettenia sp. CY-1]|nr:carbonic anhydrase family protein [Candidatus Jettenia sp.]WKZ17984.1 MAG: carbonic anhydrase family protein [Candidatus Jettenia sp. CY-1]